MMMTKISAYENMVKLIPENSASGMRYGLAIVQSSLTVPKKVMYRMAMRP